MLRSSPAKPPARDSAEGCLPKGSTGSRDWILLPRIKCPRRFERRARKKGREGAEREGEGRRGKRELTARDGGWGGSRGGGEGAGEGEEKEGKGKEYERALHPLLRPMSL